MMKAQQRWFLVSLVHPALSTLCVILGSTITGGPLGWLGYSAALLSLLANLPGVIVIKQFYRSTPLEPASTKFLVYFSMIAITWLFVVVPACYLISRLISNRTARSSVTRW